MPGGTSSFFGVKLQGRKNLPGQSFEYEYELMLIVFSPNKHCFNLSVFPKIGTLNNCFDIMHLSCQFVPYLVWKVLFQIGMIGNFDKYLNVLQKLTYSSQIEAVL